MNWLLDRIWGRKLRRQTRIHLRQVSESSKHSSRRAATETLDRLAGGSDQSVVLGQTEWNQAIQTPLDHIMKAYSLITGGTGSGKTRFALHLIKSVLSRLPDLHCGFGVIDPKGDLYAGTLFLLHERLKDLAGSDPAAAKDLRRRIVICDFGCGDPVSLYNLLSPWPGTDLDFFASSRAEMILDLMAGSDGLSLGGTALLQKLLLLLAGFRLPITCIEEVLGDPDRLSRLVAESKDASVRSYFTRQFPAVPKATVAALERRLNALFASTSVRLSLSADSAPDFRDLMDKGHIILVNCFGQSISRDVRRVLQSLVVSDIRQAVFARKSPGNTFTWFADEAQNFFVTPALRDGMADLLTMSRSFGSFFCFLTQNMSTAVQDARMLSTVHTNIRWSFSMRGEPSDAAFLKSILPITGRRPRPRRDPYTPQTFCTPAEERGLMLDEIATLPDRTGWLSLRTEAAEAILMRTPDLDIPSGLDIDRAVSYLKRDPTFGGRMSKKQYDRIIAERNLAWNGPAEVAGNFDQVLTAAYRKRRGKADGGA